ncbi:MAG: DUF1330 domain-containing protein [Halobacteriales archaeon]|nr:DUF1330 domain-containing protein [Halobacteriales archaeon]
MAAGGACLPTSPLDVDVHDAERYRAYLELGQAAVAQHGGRFLVRGGAPEPLEGSWAPKRFVVIEFPDRAAAKRWFDSPAYRKAREARKGAATWEAVVVDGVTAT